MPILDGKLVFGYPGDGGVGSQLIEQVLTGSKTATALPRNECSPAMLHDTFASVGKLITVEDTAGEAKARILVTRVFECPLDAPSDELVLGEGYGSDAAAFIRDHFAPPDPRSGSGSADAADRLNADLQTLPPLNRLVVLLHDGLGWSAAEIIEATGIPEGRTNQALRRGRMMLRRARGTTDEAVSSSGLTLIAVLFELAAPSLPAR